MRCEHCGNEQEGGTFCEACGLMMTRIRVTVPAAPAAEESKAKEATVRCDACGAEQPESKFCEKCGMRLDIFRPAPPEPPPARCPECGTVTGRQICPGCGTRIYATEES